jgi:hypothetical protein
MIRYCKDIGLWTIDRPRSTCVHRTPFCAKSCYNRKLYTAFPNLVGRDEKNACYWAEMNGDTVREFLDRRRSPVKRFRFCTRGEAFSDLSDVAKVAEIAEANPGRVFWVPTRGWRKAEIRNEIERRIFPLSNVRVLASIDPSNTGAEVYRLTERGWSTIFFGDDNATRGRVKCPKTWGHKDGHCTVCRKGCFNKNRVDVHLKQH